MKQVSYCIALFTIIFSIFSSCSDTVTYADQVAAEKSLIADYVKRNNIHAISTFPTDTNYWSAAEHKNDYFLSASGLYIRLLKVGSSVKADTIERLNWVGPRYEAYTLTATADTTVKYLSTSAYPEPVTFLFGSGVYTNLCSAFNEAAGYMKRNNSEARLIVPSKIGFSADATAIRPMGYHYVLHFKR